MTAPAKPALMALAYSRLHAARAAAMGDMVKALALGAKAVLLGIVDIGSDLVSVDQLVR